MSQLGDPDLQLLLRGLHSPLALDARRWDRVLRLARASGLHARLAASNLDTPGLPDVVRRHLSSAARIAAYRAQMLRAELFHLSPLCQGDFPVIVLKGAAYLLQGRPMATGRFVSDLDLLVPSAHLHTMEARLRSAGWKPEDLTPYDERYYRDWSHETPPMRLPGHALELDLHHAITPTTGSLAFDPATLFERSVPIPGTPFCALAGEDQVLHACLHCFHDGDLVLRLREVVDIDGLIRAFAPEPHFWDTLLARAQALQLGRPLWYGLHFAHHWLRCPVPETVMRCLPAPPTPALQFMDALVPCAMLPPDPDGPPALRIRLARKALLARYHLLRMPLRLLLPHLARKAALRMRTPAHKKKGAPENGAP